MTHKTDTKNSDRLLPVLQMLLDEKKHSSIELRSTNNSCAIATDVSDLRKDGWIIESEYKGLSENNRKVYDFWLIGKQGLEKDTAISLAKLIIGNHAQN
jgi:hypothetical protein